MMSAAFLGDLAGRIDVGWLIETSIKSSILLIAALALSFALRRAQARLRYAVWTIAVLGVLALPLLSAVAPDVEVALLPEVTRFDGAPAQTGVITATERPAPSVNEFAEPSPRRVEKSSGTSIAAGQSAVRPGWYERAVSALARLDWAQTAFAVWLLGTLIAVAGLVRGLMRVHHLARVSARITGGCWFDALQYAAARSGVKRLPDLREGPISVPATWGVLRPVIVVPAGVDDWSLERRQLVLLHELTHVKRFDWLVHTAARLARAVYWFNPLVWIGSSRLAVERELSCDDAVIAFGARPSDYAKELLDVARTTGTRRETAVALTMATRNTLEGRLMSILDNKRPSGRRWLAAPIALAVLLVCIATVEPWGGPAEPAELASSQQAPKPITEPSPVVVPQAETVIVPLADPDARPGVYGGDNYTWSYNTDVDDETHVSIRLRGLVEFNEDGTEIERLEPGSTLRVSLEYKGTDYEMYLRADEEVDRGRDRYATHFYVDGDSREMDDRLKKFARSATQIAYHMLERNRVMSSPRYLVYDGPSSVRTRDELVAQVRAETRYNVARRAAERSRARKSVQSEIDRMIANQAYKRARIDGIGNEIESLHRQHERVGRMLDSKDDDEARRAERLDQLIAERLSSLESELSRANEELLDARYDRKLEARRAEIEDMSLSDQLAEMEARVDATAQSESVERRLAELYRARARAPRADVGYVNAMGSARAEEHNEMLEELYEEIQSIMKKMRSER